MKYELQPLDDIKVDFVEKGNSTIEGVIYEIKRTAFGLGSEAQLMLYIQNHQYALLEKINTHPVKVGFDSLLYFLETYFPKHVNPDATMSYHGLQLLLDSILPHIQYYLKHTQSAVGDLHLVIQPLLAIQYLPKLSIAQARYIQFFWKHFNKDVQQQAKDKASLLIDTLLSCNFNTQAFSKWLIQKIDQEQQQVEALDIQFEILNTHLSNLRKVCVNTQYIFEPSLPSTYKLVKKWLKEHIKYIQQQLEFQKEQAQSTPQNNTMKLETSLSVAQLACWVSGMYKAGILINDSQAEVLQVVSQTFRCKKAGQISFGSLQNKYYNIEYKTRETVSNIILSMGEQLTEEE